MSSGERSSFNRQQQRHAHDDVGVQVCAYTKRVHAVTIRGMVGGDRVGRHGHEIHYDGRDDTTARKYKKTSPAEQSISLALDVQTGVFQQQMCIETALKNAVCHDWSGGENYVVKRLICIIENFLATEAVAQTKQPHAKRKRQALVKEVKDQHRHAPIIPLPMHEDESFQIPVTATIRHVSSARGPLVRT